MAKMKVSYKENSMLLGLGLATAIVGFLAGLGFQKFISSHSVGGPLHFGIASGRQRRSFDSVENKSGEIERDYKWYHEVGIRSVNNSRIREELRYFTKQPHLAGTPAGKEQADYVLEEWGKHGFDHVEMKRYDVTLSYPNSPSVVQVLDEKGDLYFQATMEEPAFYEAENSSESVYPFNAYSAAGTVEAEYVYVNFAEIRDFVWLRQRNVPIAGKIFIARYGFSFRGEKARLTQENGGVGLLLFPDPEDFAAQNTTYPLSWGLPSRAIPRGNIVNIKGDPRTPGYPAKDNYFRLPFEKVSYLSKIPVTPISYGDAHAILSAMDGLPVPDPDWQGGMNFTYRVNNKTPRKIRMTVDTKLEQRPIYNVIGTIKGEVEPDRIVLVGNHRDAWVFGALDPSSGTAALMEVARSMGNMLKSGWRPRRTIMILNWDAEEYGLVGSVEWVEEYYNILANRAVAYINVDIAVEGNHTLRIKSTPLLIDAFYGITKSLDDPNNSSMSLYATWLKRKPEPVYRTEPSYDLMGSGSDFTAFYSTVGVPCMDLRHMWDQNAHGKLPHYPAYHTIYDNYNWFTKFIDPDFKYTAVVTKLMLAITVELADATLLPFNLTRYALKIAKDADTYEKNFKELLKPNGVSLDIVKRACAELINATLEFHQRVEKAIQDNCNSLRRINDQLMQFDRAFILPEGTLDRTSMRHIIYSPSRKKFFSGHAFPTLSEALYDIEFGKNGDWDNVQIQVSTIASVLERAANLLKDYHRL